nr:MAG TPA: Toll/interleukin-1 receptor domain [Caudoviricetes sp.]
MFELAIIKPCFFLSLSLRFKEFGGVLQPPHRVFTYLL